MVSKTSVVYMSLQTVPSNHFFDWQINPCRYLPSCQQLSSIISSMPATITHAINTMPMLQADAQLAAWQHHSLRAAATLGPTGMSAPHLALSRCVSRKDLLFDLSNTSSASYVTMDKDVGCNIPIGDYNIKTRLGRHQMLQLCSKTKHYQVKRAHCLPYVLVSMVCSRIECSPVTRRSRETSSPVACCLFP